MNKLILLFLFITACGHMTLDRSTQGNPETTDVQSRNIDSYFWGLMTTRLPSEIRICPEGQIRTMEFYSTTGDVLLSVITLGIYIPHRMDFNCTRRTLR